MALFGRDKAAMVDPANALPGRTDQQMYVAPQNIVTGTPMNDIPEGYETAILGFGCFWGAERKYWNMPGVWTTAVGYSGGYTPNPTYEEVCSGRTGHAEVVLVVFSPAVVAYEEILKVFWEAHDPTQLMRQGNDVGTQYRSGIWYTTDEQKVIAERSRERYQEALREQGYGEIATEITAAGPFYYAEDYHQQYLEKNPNGYCGLPDRPLANYEPFELG
jgi:peptide-methionine (S)-S-oxide reductase